MVSRNGDSISFRLGITGGIIALIALILTCIGVGLPSWYIASNANHTLTLAQCGLFSSCYIANASQTTASSTFTCVAYSSYVCSTSSFRQTVLNVTGSISGCINPNSDAAIYSSIDAPIYQTSIEDFYRLRAAAVLAIISILFIFFAMIFAFLSGVIILNVYLVFIAPILTVLALIFGICGLAVAGSVFSYNGAGFALFTVGILLECIVICLLSIIAGRLNGMRMRSGMLDDEAFLHSSDSYNNVRQIQKRKP